jgi:hypothetical protein
MGKIRVGLAEAEEKSGIFSGRTPRPRHGRGLGVQYQSMRSANCTATEAPNLLRANIPT